MESCFITGTMSARELKAGNEAGCFVRGNDLTALGILCPLLNIEHLAPLSRG